MRFLFRIIFVLVLSPLSYAAFDDPILKQIKPGVITIIGETHKNIESVEWFQRLVSETLKHHQCVIIGLEIGSDQQLILDDAMQRKASVNDIALWPPVDYPPYRRLLEQLALFQQQGHCIQVIALDSGFDNPIDRDVWMALTLAQAVGDQPILVLLGGLHSLKKVQWRIKTGRPSVAEILTRRGFKVKSFPQRWLPGTCANTVSRAGVFISAQSPQAKILLNDSLLALIKAKSQQSASGVIDGVVVWTCVTRNQSAAMTQ